MNPDIEEQNEAMEQIREVPLCIRCARPVDPLSHYCPHCGETIGQFTPCIPFVNLRMQVTFWMQAWYQLWSRRISLAGRCLRLLMIVLLFPMMFLAMPFLLWEKFILKKRPPSAG